MGDRGLSYRLPAGTEKARALQWLGDDGWQPEGIAAAARLKMRARGAWGEGTVTLPVQLDATKTAADPSEEIRKIFDAELDTACMAESRGQKIYRSVQVLGQIIGGEYGDRVLFELLQNAHDALLPTGGRVAVHLEEAATDKAALYVANDGVGFRREDLNALRNIANSSKDIGAGIGNKGVGFRSVEALSSDPRVYSCQGEAGAREAFDGYCFRLATAAEVTARLVALGKHTFAKAVGDSMPRYLATVPIDEQPEAVRRFARSSFATVVVLPLTTADAVSLARRQVKELLSSTAPVLLFLSRIVSLEIRTERQGATDGHTTLSRRALQFDLPVLHEKGVACELVTLGEEAPRWLVVQRKLLKADVIAAVKRSTHLEPGLSRWLDWRGDARVSAAVAVEGSGVSTGRLYNFLPMGPDAQAPFFGHVDAPFYTAINRERARLELPLNAYLLDCAAQLCATVAMALPHTGSPLPVRCTVDFVAWRHDFARLQAGFAAAGRRLDQAEVWPTTAGRWRSLGKIHSWPQGTYKVFTSHRATKAGALDILNTRIGPDRLQAIESLASAIGSTCIPPAATFATWAELVARSLPIPEQSDLWGDFYTDLVAACPRGHLECLSGRKIIVDTRGQWVAAGEDVYARQESSRRRRTEGVPLPPSALARQLTILSENVAVKPQTVAAFEQAKLWRGYDATEILERLPTLFGSVPAPARRSMALVWAFKVWKHDGPGARRVLRSADLHVPTRGGWLTAKLAAFSQTWTSLGRDLDTYLAEARASSRDCDAMASALLVDQLEWPEPLADERREWIRFLADAGVTDGIPLVAAAAPAGPTIGGQWEYALRHTGDKRMDAAWWTNCDFTQPKHPYTYYWRDGEAWAFPGQEIVHHLSNEGRLRFAVLVTEYLQRAGDSRFKFNILRTDRHAGAQDSRSVRTPLATFLGTAEWVPMEAADEIRFVALSDAWLIRDRKSEPKFVPRVADEVVGAIAQDGAAIEILCRPRMGLNVWRDKQSAVGRLQVLAAHCEVVSQHERAVFRKSYEQAWHDLVESGKDLPREVAVVVERAAGLTKVLPAAPAVSLYVRTEESTELAKLLMDSGAPVLAITDASLGEAVIAKLNASGSFAACAVRDADVRLQVDGIPFATSLDDPLLVEVVPWLGEALVVGHELGARTLERGAHVGPSLERLRRLRLRRAARLELASAAGVSKRLERHLFRDDSRPTLIVQAPFNTRSLGDAASLIAPHVNANLRTFELLLVRLSYRLENTEEFPTIRPTEADYADAAQADIEAVREHLSAHRHDDEALLDRLAPVLVYYLGIEAGRLLIGQLAATTAARWRSLFERHLTGSSVEELLAVAKATEDLAEVRKKLCLDYQRFNQALQRLGRPSLTSENELRRLFDLWKDDLASNIRDRLRRHFAHRFATPEFAQYAELRSLDFLDFDPTWVDTHELITREDVQSRADAWILARFGVDPSVALPPLDALRVANRKAVARTAERSLPILRVKAERKLAGDWLLGPAEVAAAVDRRGLLDFHEVDEHEALILLERAGLWPEGVPLSIDLTAHGLSLADLDNEKRLAGERQAEERKRMNSIPFLGTSFDTSESDFASKFAAVAFDALAQGNWQSRSSMRLTKLAEQEQPTRRDRTGGRAGPGKASNRPPEAVRAGIGLAGELLAFCYLQNKHKDRFSDACWVSENRSSRFPEPGDLSLGYDFRVNTSDREWLYEVKATPGELCEFELTENEYRVAISAAPDRSRRYRILFIQYALDPTRCRVLELPNPATESGRRGYRVLGRGAVRMRFGTG